MTEREELLAELAKFGEFDADGLVKPREPFSWETLARVAIDFANAIAAQAAPTQAPAQPTDPLHKFRGVQAFLQSAWRTANANIGVDRDDVAIAIRTLQSALDDAAAQAAPSAPDAQTAMHDALRDRGFSREEDWFVKYPGEEYVEQIHVDTLAMLARATAPAQPAPQRQEDAE